MYLLACFQLSSVLCFENTAVEQLFTATQKNTQSLRMLK